MPFQYPCSLGTQSGGTVLSHKNYGICLGTCVDGKFLPKALQTASSIIEEWQYVDVMTLPGGAKDLNFGTAIGNIWVNNYVAVSLAKHGVNRITLVNHLHCGAYSDMELRLAEEEAVQGEDLLHARQFLDHQIPLVAQNLLLRFGLDLPREERENLERMLKVGRVAVSGHLITPCDRSRPAEDVLHGWYAESLF